MPCCVAKIKRIALNEWRRRRRFLRYTRRQHDKNRWAPTQIPLFLRYSYFIHKKIAAAASWSEEAKKAQNHAPSVVTSLSQFHCKCCARNRIVNFVFIICQFTMCFEEVEPTNAQTHTRWPFLFINGLTSPHGVFFGSCLSPAWVALYYSEFELRTKYSTAILLSSSIVFAVRNMFTERNSIYGH